MKTIAAILMCAVAAFFVSAGFDAPAEAKKVHAPKGAKKVGKSVTRGVRNAGRSVGNAARWGGNAIWVGTGVGLGHARLTKNCNYYAKRYNETRDPKWKNQYNACIR